MIKNFNIFQNLNENVKLSKIAKKIEIDGYIILIGRNAIMNDILTFEIADKEDIWMHTSGVPGSHIVIKLEGKENPPKNIIEYAAKLSAKNSKSKGKTKVVYTKIKNVSKNKEHNDGQVSVDYKKSKIIEVYV